MQNIIRSLQPQIEKVLYKGKVIIVYGARRVGKTTLCKNIIQNQDHQDKKTRYINCELLVNKQMLETTNHESLYQYLKGYDLVVLDEAQGIKNIGLVLKILVDTYPHIQIIATGSSSFDLANKTGEPLTGRARRFVLYPLGVWELLNQQNLQQNLEPLTLSTSNAISETGNNQPKTTNQAETINHKTPFSNQSATHFQIDALDLQSRLDNLLRFGLMPTVFTQSEEEAVAELNEIASNYLYKDVLEFEKVRRSELLMTLLQALSLQLGNEFTYRELAKMTGTNHNTVKYYLDLLEKCFVIFTLKAYTKKKRKELKVLRQKAFFYDLGLRNAIINNFNKLDLRNDVGGLWENFLILERIKRNQAVGSMAQGFFWKTIQNHEVDYIEEQNGQIQAWEYKWSPETIKKPSSKLDISNQTKPKTNIPVYRLTKGERHKAEFLSYYPTASFEVVHRLDWLGFVS
jgi:predicted AAA+ superfamily ATPase